MLTTFEMITDVALDRVHGGTAFPTDHPLTRPARKCPPVDRCDWPSCKPPFSGGRNQIDSVRSPNDGSDLAYWTPERLRDAKPMPMPTL